MLIEKTDNHNFIVGLTRSGKSTFTRRAMLEYKGQGVIYLNIQGERVEKGFLSVRSSDVASEQLIEMLKAGAKVNFLFDDTRKAYIITAGYLIDLMMNAGFTDKHPVYVVIDECHLLKGYALEMVKVCATAGLKKGVRLVFITQRPANADKTLYTQSFRHYIFRVSSAEKQYFINKGIDFEQCLRLWSANGDYSYCVYDGYKLEGKRGI